MFRTRNGRHIGLQLPLGFAAYTVSDSASVIFAGQYPTRAAAEQSLGAEFVPAVMVVAP